MLSLFLQLYNATVDKLKVDKSSILRIMRTPNTMIFIIHCILLVKIYNLSKNIKSIIRYD
nr:hypothetical protein GTC16762_30710 [Pigmentibacter ruber]